MAYWLQSFYSTHTALIPVDTWRRYGSCIIADILVVCPGRLWSKSIASCTILRNLFAQRFPVHLFVKHKGGIRFCHCNEPIRMWQYRTTCFLPILLLGILPLLYGMATGNYYFTLFGTFLLIGSIDDLCILWKLRSFSKDAFINDCSQELRFHIW